MEQKCLSQFLAFGVQKVSCDEAFVTAFLNRVEKDVPAVLIDSFLRHPLHL